MTTSDFDGRGWSINAAGAIAGGYADRGFWFFASTWSAAGVRTDLGDLAGRKDEFWSVGQGINDFGQIAGWSYLAGDFVQHATFWGGAALTDLGTLGGENSQALALNSLGQAVGWSELADGSQHAMLWNGTVLIDLNSLLDPALASAGWVLKEAAGINDHGAIVGTAINSLLGIDQGHAFLLSPVFPNPKPMRCCWQAWHGWAQDGPVSSAARGSWYYFSREWQRETAQHHRSRPQALARGQRCCLEKFERFHAHLVS